MKNRELKPRKRGWVATALRRYLQIVNHPIYFRHFHTPGRERMPKDGNPVVVVSNHQNCLIDPLGLVFSLSDRKPRFLARASVFKNPILNKVIRGLGALPTYRAKFDGIKGVAKNKGTLEEVAKSLSHGETVVLYPEGQHQNKRWLGPFSQAYLKMAFGAAEEFDFDREVYVMPTANHYSHYRLPREDMMIAYGEPVALSPYYERYKEQPREVMSEVNDIVRGQIEHLMLNIEDLDHYAEIDFLRSGDYGRVWAEKHSYRADYLPDKLASDKDLVAALATLSEREPEKAEEIFEQTRHLVKGLRKMGFREWLLRRGRGVGEFALFLLGMLVGLAPFVAAIGTTWPVFVLPLLVNRAFIKDRQFRGSINLAVTLLVTYPLCGFVPSIVMLCQGDWLMGLGWLVLFPVAVIYATNYMRWSRKLLGYARFVLAKKKDVEKLRKRRKKLYEELDKLLCKER
ncbi:MAG: 1-acyl-sn-glycerol-3-phosphate acyltransferase [Tidjanibacter sp.]|nr:1-acyl-sn-glycerol-3-phosphate acyltransferase [Tidjanibacter sp.]